MRCITSFSLLAAYLPNQLRPTGLEYYSMCSTKWFGSAYSIFPVVELLLEWMCLQQSTVMLHSACRHANHE